MVVMSIENFDNSIFSRPLKRRALLKGGLLLGLGLALPVPAFCLPDENLSAERAISLYNLHTGEALHDAVYWHKGAYVDETLQDLNWLLRDFRANQVKPIDPNLFDLIFLLREKLCSSSPLHVISGYRSPATNRELRKKSKGVAKHSLHIEGKAMDIRMPGCDLRNLRKAAMELQVGGVGYYPRSEFVHVDTGRVRYW